MSREKPNVGVTDPLADHLRLCPALSALVAVEPLSEGFRMRWATVLEGEDVVAGVIGGAEQVLLAVVALAPSAQRGEGGAVD